MEVTRKLAAIMFTDIKDFITEDIITDSPRSAASR
jgi:hypothetical protein